MAINNMAVNLGVDVIGNNKKLKLFEKYNHKFWRIDNPQSAIRKVFYPIISENFKIAQGRKEQYPQKQAKKEGGLPISLSKFGNFIRPHLNSKELAKLLMNDIILDYSGQNIVDIRKSISKNADMGNEVEVVVNEPHKKG